MARKRSWQRRQENAAEPLQMGKDNSCKILAQQEYCGVVINFKTYSKSFKNKTRLENPRENWAVFKNVHEPIITVKPLSRCKS